MGTSSLFTIVTASMGVGTPARAQPINNGSMATCTGHLTAEGSELANRVANDAKLAANLVTKNDANLALPPRFRQVLTESPL
ncbi:hypothetical protein TNCV_4285051 [Trichonephila clavipes]|nr:hypothetical protein TNCV_4285051 [Trichonephila clavipes]